MTAAVILAAGRGSRLGKYSAHLPKALVRVGGRSLLDWHLQALTECAVTSIVVAGGYRNDRLARDGIELVEMPRWNEAGPLASLIATQPARFDQGFLVVYADCPHHSSNLRRMLAHRADVAVAGDRTWESLWKERRAEILLDAETYRSAGGFLRSIGAKPRRIEEIDAQFAGLLHFTPQGWKNAEHIAATSRLAPTDMTGLLAALLAAGESVADVPIHGRWCEIDSADDLRLCRRRLQAGDGWSHDWRDQAGSTRWR